MPSQYPSIQSFFRKEVKGGEGMSALSVVGNSNLQGRGGSTQGDGFGRDSGGVERGGKDGEDGEDEFGDGFTVSSYERLSSLVYFMQFLLVRTFLSSLETLFFRSSGFAFCTMFRTLWS